MFKRNWVELTRIYIVQLTKINKLLHKFKNDLKVDAKDIKIDIKNVINNWDAKCVCKYYKK